MITLLLLHVFISLLCFLAGFTFYRILFDKKINEHRPFIIYMITGLIILTIINQIIVLFLPVTIITSIFLLIFFASILIFSKKGMTSILISSIKHVKNLHILTKTGLLITWLLLLLLNAGPTMMDDTESYHIQMIKWINDYGTVPGIANLHERFGFNTSWFIDVALFTFSEKQPYYTALNGTIAVWFSFYLWLRIDDLLTSNTNTVASISFSVLIMLALCMISWPVLRGNAGTANYDIITAVVVVILFLESFIGKSLSNAPQLQVEWFLWPLYLVTIRIINYPLLFLSLFIIVLLVIQKKWKLMFFYLIFGLLLIGPFFFRNVMLSGYPFYPSFYFDWFHFDWKVDEKVLTDLLYYIKYYNRVNPMYQSLEQTASLHFPFWLRDWFRYLFLYDKILVIPGLLGYLSPIVLMRKSLVQNHYFLLFYIVLVVQTLSWFFIAPDPRFNYGGLLCGILLFFIALSTFLKNYFLKKSGAVIAVAVLLFITILPVYKIKSDKRYHNPYVPYPLPQPPVRKIQLNNIELNIPEKVLSNWNPRCYATPLPCLYKVDPRLRMRGATISEGFTIK